jgi:hypothetical protein
MLTELTAAIFDADIATDVNTFRQNLQLEYVDRLLRVVNASGDNAHDRVAQSMALDRLRWIQAEMLGSRRGDTETRAHRAHVLYRIQRGLDETEG